MQVLFTNYYGAKFARERKLCPADWMIVPTRSGYELVKLR